MTAVFDYSESTGSDRLVLLVIADRAHDDGSGCWRSKESIARMAKVSRATVTRSIAHLEEIGELVVDRRPGTTSEYVVNLPGVGSNRAVPPVDNPGDTDVDIAAALHMGAQVEPGGGSPVSRDTSLSVSTRYKTSNPRNEPPPVSLGRTVDSPPLWEELDDGTVRWIGDGPPPTPTHNRYAGSYRKPPQ